MAHTITGQLSNCSQAIEELGEPRGIAVGTIDFTTYAYITVSSYSGLVKCTVDSFSCALEDCEYALSLYSPLVGHLV